MAYLDNFRTLLNMYKALGDETRLRIIGLLSEEERNVGELAQLLGLTEPTVSHHLSKIRAVGLVKLRTAGNQRFYSLNQAQIERLADLTARIQTLKPSETPENNTDWVDDLPLSAEDRKLLKNYTFQGRLTQIPNKTKKLMPVLRWLALQFEPKRTYTEAEVNSIISGLHEDYATLRRELVEFGFMRRERGGGDYWLTPEDE